MREQERERERARWREKAKERDGRQERESEQEGPRYREREREGDQERETARWSRHKGTQHVCSVSAGIISLPCDVTHSLSLSLSKGKQAWAHTHTHTQNRDVNRFTSFLSVVVSQSFTSPNYYSSSGPLQPTHTLTASHPHTHPPTRASSTVSVSEKYCSKQQSRKENHC